MKKYLWLIIALCSGWLVSCKEDDPAPTPPEDESTVELMGGSIVVKTNPDEVTVESRDYYPEGISTEESFEQRNNLGVKSINAVNEGSSDQVLGNDYRFKLVAEVSTFKIAGEEVQATHVKITDDAKYAFVSYNTKGDTHKGAIGIFSIAVNNEGSENVSVTATNIALIELPKAEISAIDYNSSSKLLYAVGASEEPAFGYTESDGKQFDYAFFMVVPLKSDMTPNTSDESKYVVKHLTSFQSTSVKYSGSKLYVTTGDGQNGTKGGLYVINTDNYSMKFIEKQYARSVDVNGSNVYLMQSQPARISKYTLDGTVVTENMYNGTGESLQANAKSELLAWKGTQASYLFAAMNESGMKMLKDDGSLVDYLDRPGTDANREVTNSVSLNTDKKKNIYGGDIASNLLLLANGEKGIYWYDVAVYNKKEQLLLCNNNSFSFGEGNSANFVTSKGNIVFVADGLGGLKILYIGFNPGVPPEPPIPGLFCTEFMSWLYGSASALLPEGQSVFRTAADPIIATLFEDPSSVPYYVEVLDETAVYINFVFEGAGWHNGFGFYVVPAANCGTQAEFMAYAKNIKENEMWETPAGYSSKRIKDKHIIFNNVDGTILQSGQSWQIKNYNSTEAQGWRFNQGDRIVFFIAGNCWNSQNSWVTYSASGYQMPIFTNWKQNLADKGYTDNCAFGKGKGEPTESKSKSFWGIQYNTFYSQDCNSIVMFFEDQMTTSCDVDYNDIFFTIFTEKEGAGEPKLSKPKYYLSTESVTGDSSEKMYTKGSTTLYMGINPDWTAQQ